MVMSHGLDALIDKRKERSVVFGKVGSRVLGWKDCMNWGDGWMDERRA
jgi:hypothetical protein